MTDEIKASFGSLTIVDRMREEGDQIGRYKVRSLIKEARPKSKQPKLRLQNSA
jgi:hypothetical protein